MLKKALSDVSIRIFIIFRPLSEPKELKIRFDAIFEVTKYVKALDNIKKNIKELEIQIRIIDAELPALKSDLESKANVIRIKKN